MPRHGQTLVLDDSTIARPSGKDFIEARRPVVRYVTPEPVWIVNSISTRRWYYKAAPDVGEKIHYLEDGFATRVTRVTPFAIYFADSSVMRRGYIGSRILGWSLPRLRTLTTHLPRRAPSRASSTPRQVILF